MKKILLAVGLLAFVSLQAGGDGAAAATKPLRLSGVNRWGFCCENPAGTFKTVKSSGQCKGRIVSYDKCSTKTAIAKR